MYYRMVFMTDSFLGLSSESFHLQHDQQWLKSKVERRQNWNFTFNCVVPLALVMAAAFLGPEKPHQLASICERHNPVIACQVW